MAPDLDWRAVRAFTAVAQRGGFTSAARALGVTQSAVSHALRRLEEQLGCRLLYKKGKTPHLTPAGHTFLQQAQRALDQMERAAESVAPAADGTGTLRLIFSASTAQALLAPVLREYRDCYPQLSINVQLEDTPHAIRAVEEGRCDLALGIRDSLPGSLAAVPLFEDELHFAVSPQHAWAEKKRIAPADLAREHFILYRRGSLTFQAIEAHFLQTGSRLGSYVEIPSFEVMKELIKLGLGVGLMAPWVMAEELEAGSLVSIPLTRPAIVRRWGLLHQKDRALRPSEQTFIGLCRMAVPRLLHGTRR